MFEIFSVSDSVVLFVNAAVPPSVLSLCVSSDHAFPEFIIHYTTLILHAIVF